MHARNLLLRGACLSVCLLLFFSLCPFQSAAHAAISREKTAQALLLDLGYYAGAVSGEWTAENVSSARRFQKARTPEEDGAPTETLLDALWAAREERNGAEIPREERADAGLLLDRAREAKKKSADAFHAKYEIVEAEDPRYVLLKERASGKISVRFDMNGLSGNDVEEWRTISMLSAEVAPSGGAILFVVNIPCAPAAMRMLGILLYDLEGELLLDSTESPAGEPEDAKIGFSADGETILAVLDEGGVAWNVSRLMKDLANRRKGRVRLAQTMLGNLGYDAGKIDGAFGPRTEKAVRAFCKKMRLPYPGGLSEELLKKMWTAEKAVFGYSNLPKEELLFAIATGMALDYAAVSPDGKSVMGGSGGGAVGGTDNEVRLWDLSNGRPLHRFANVEDDGVYSRTMLPSCVARYSPDGKSVLVGSERGYAKLWSVGSGKPVRVFRQKEIAPPVISTAFSPDGKELFIGVGGDPILDTCYGTVWNIRDKTPRALFHSSDGVWIAAAAFSPDGKKILFTDIMNDRAGVMDASTGETLGTCDSAKAALYSPKGDGILVVQAPASFDEETGKERAAFFSALLWDGSFDRLLHTLDGHRNEITSAAFSADGARIVTGSLDGAAKLWDADTGRCLFTLEGHFDGVLSVAFSPDGGRILTGSADGTARLWDAETGKVVSVMPCDTGEVFFVGFSPDGGRAITAGRDGVIRVFSVEQKKP